MVIAGQHLTRHLTQGLQEGGAFGVHLNSNLKSLCQHLQAVSNAGSKYSEIVSNNKKLDIKGSSFSIDRLNYKILSSEEKIIQRIKALSSQPMNAKKYSTMEKRVDKNIRHLKEKIKKSDTMLEKLIAPNVNKVPGYARLELRDFCDKKKACKEFIISMSLPILDQKNPPNYALFSPPNYKQALNSQLHTELKRSS